MSISTYQIFITPLKTNTTYGDQVEVTDYVIAGGVGKIKQSIDSGNFDIGIYTVADLNIKLVNYDGRFNDETDSASMFYFTRDRAKVQVKYIDEASGINVVFNGLINDEATTQDFEKDEIKFRVLSLDSIFRKIKVPGGLINNGNTSIEAFTALLNRPSITNVLGFDAGKIAVGTNSIIDDVTSFSQKDSRVVLESLLNASGSVFYIDDTGDMVVSTRDVSVVSDLELFGGGDPLQRDNITQIKNFNTGLQRTFNTITVNGTTSSDDDFAERYGAGIKSYTFEFITTSSTNTAIADFFSGAFKVPKAELEVVVKTDIAKDAAILDPVSISFEKRHKGFNGNKIPLAGASVAGTDVAPFIVGGTKITNNKNWKIIGINIDTKTFLTTLRLREV
jgi:hypothetical protein